MEGSDDVTGEDSVEDGSPATSGIDVPGYVVGARIGAGGFGEVFRATHSVIGREVAIKVLHDRYSGDSEAVGRFIAEARAVGKISHPGIVDLFEFGRLGDGRHFAVMELIRGRTLRDVLRERDRLPLAEALPILRSIAEAIDAAHAAGIAHRDLKPDNVFVVDAERGVTKLIDFGLAKLTNEVAITQTGSVFGTPLYMSPEQCRGKGVDMRTDCYSFGALAYHVLTGKPPFTETDALALALQHLNEVPDPPSKRVPGLGVRVDRVLAAMLAKDPADRPMPITSAIEALADGPLPKHPPRPRRRRWPIAFAGAAVVAVAAIVAVRPWSRSARSSTVSTVGDTCPAAKTRVAGVWDADRRAAVAKQFSSAKRPDIANTAELITRYLDDYTSRWTAQWDSACASPDRESDALLYAQRIACLDTGLIGLRGASESLRTIDIQSFSEAFTGTFNLPSLDDCQTTEVLRAQVPPPPADKRDEVTRLLTEVHDARAEIRTAVNNDGGAEQLQHGLDRLASIAKQLTALGSPMAVLPLRFRLGYLVSETLVKGGTDQFAGAIKAIQADLAIAIQRAEKDRNEQELVNVLGEQIRLEIAIGSPAKQVEADIDRAELALARAGHPLGPAVGLAEQRAHFEARRGNVDRAIELLRAALPEYERHVYVVDFANPRSALPALLSRAGRHDEAIAVTREALAINSKALGPDHWATLGLHSMLAIALVRSGNLDAALAQLDAQIAGYQRIGASGRRRGGPLELRFQIAARTGRPELVASTYDALQRLADARRIAGGAGGTGHLEAFRYALTKLPETPGIEDGRAYLAYMVGDIDEMRRHAELGPKVIPPSGSDADQPMGPSKTLFGAVQAPWFLALADATAGRAAVVDARFATIAKTYTQPDLLQAVTLSALGKNKQAHDLMERAFTNERVSVQGEDWNTGELQGWRGIFRFETGDVAGSIEPLELGIAAFEVCCEGFHYVMPRLQFTLARALWQTGGDHARARLLVTQARDGFARLGKFKERDRLATEQWLADHQ
ncbi:MAG TPA: serine/threonine-protein kinase [Kofleriaceae bacterium]|nr:serine/threonine-protein kinase [Kofleriaceae bacterium]